MLQVGKKRKKIWEVEVQTCVIWRGMAQIYKSNFETVSPCARSEARLLQKVKKKTLFFLGTVNLKRCSSLH